MNKQSKSDIYLHYVKDRANFSFSKKGRWFQAIANFVSEVDEINRKTFKEYVRCHAEDMEIYTYKRFAILDFLNYAGHSIRKKKQIKKIKEEHTSKTRHHHGKYEVTEEQQKIVNDFLTAIKYEYDYSVNTIAAYGTQLRKFFSITNQKVNQTTCREYINQQQQMGVSPATIHNIICTFERYAKWKNIPMSLKKIKKQTKPSLENVPTGAEYQKLTEYLKKHNEQFYIIVRLLGTTGMRCSELVTLTWEDVRNGEVLLNCKGNKYRRIFFTKTLQKETDELIKKCNLRGKLLGDRCDSTAKRYIQYKLHAYAKKLGIDKTKMHPHAFRHFFAKMFLKKQKDISQLSDLLGHSSIDTTRIYLQRSYEEQKRDFNKYVTW